MWLDQHATAYVDDLSSGKGERFLDRVMHCDVVDGMISFNNTAVHMAATTADTP